MMVASVAAPTSVLPVVFFLAPCAATRDLRPGQGGVAAVVLVLVRHWVFVHLSDPGFQ